VWWPSNCAAVHVLDRFHIMKKMNEAIDRSVVAKLPGWSAMATSRC